jgi:GTP-binding protein
LTGRFSDGQIEAGRRLFAGPRHFVLGVAAIDGLPPASLPEIAFAGRSNVGKSSLINGLAGERDLARASNTPGRTRELNFFNFGDRLHLVDMPGYGYAEAPKSEVKKWQSLFKAYLQGRQALVRCFVLIDARHGVKEADKPIMGLLDTAAVTYQLVLTKIDKIKPPEREKVLGETQAFVKKRPAAFPVVIATSSETSEGMAELRAEIAGLVGAGD